MSNLPALTQIAEEYVREVTLSNGEITEQIENLTLALMKKTDACAYVLDYMESMEDFFKEKYEEFKKARNSIEVARERLKDRIKLSMSTMDIKELNGEYYKFAMAKCQKELIIFDESLIPNIFKKQVFVLNKSLIKETLEHGDPVPGARLDGGVSLKKYINKN